jgi:hypothetical protein
MVFPAPAVLVVAWFLLTPILRFVLWFGAKRMSWLSRLILAHLLAYGIILIATAIMPRQPGEFAGMAVLFAIGQVVFLLLDILRPQGPPAA